MGLYYVVQHTGAWQSGCWVELNRYLGFKKFSYIKFSQSSLKSSVLGFIQVIVVDLSSFHFLLFLLRIHIMWGGPTFVRQSCNTAQLEIPTCLALLKFSTKILLVFSSVIPKSIDPPKFWRVCKCQCIFDCYNLPKWTVIPFVIFPSRCMP